jgi:hypothetical protein
MTPFQIVILLAIAVAAISIAVLLLEDVFASNDRRRLEDEIRAAALRRLSRWSATSGASRSQQSQVTPKGEVRPWRYADQWAMSTLTPWLVRFPDDRDPKIVIDFSGTTPTKGQEIISGWVVDRQEPATPDTRDEYRLQVWVTPARWKHELRREGGHGWRPGRCTMLDVVEYASITAALAILATSLSGAIGSVTLPSTDAKATALVASAARSSHVSGPAAKAAYDKAPYRKTSLRYLYAVAWVAAAKDRAKCQAQLLLGPDPRVAAAAAIRQTPRLLTRLRKAHVTVSQAATALGRGTEDGCA